MKYVLLFGAPADGTYPAAPHTDAVHAEIMDWWQKHASAGVILEGERLQGAATATTFRTGGDLAVETIDGPFIEAKEEVSGYGVIEVADLDAALDLARTWPALKLPGESVEVRPIYVM